MSAFFSFLGNLSAVDWLLILVAWVIVAFALGTFTGLGIALADRRDARRRVRENYMPDSEWLDAWPLGDDDEIALRFDQIVSAERWAQ